MAASGARTHLVRGFATFTLSVCMAGCGTSISTKAVPLTVTVGATTLVVAQDGTPVTLAVTISPLDATFSETVSGVPGGITQQSSTSSSGPLGNVTFVGSAAAGAGSYPVILTVSEGGQTATANFRAHPRSLCPLSG